MFLTRMYLNPRRRQTIRFARDAQAMHAAVASSFSPGREPGRLLWRLDRNGDEMQLMIVSSAEPSLEHVQEQAGWANEQTWDTRSYEPLLQRLARGQQFGFRLAANPVRTETGEDGVKRRVAHVSTGYQQLWLAQRAELMGVRFLDGAGSRIPIPEQNAEPPGGLEDVLVSHRETLRFRRSGQPVTIARIRFEGALEVADADALRHVLVNGIGKAKGYGCGLLTLAPVRSVASAGPAAAAADAR